jgi:precorrin-6Y C5,15-methyltransferase (decarboxylating)
MAKPQIHVIGMGLDGVAGLSATARSQLEAATCIAGSDRYLQLCSEHIDLSQVQTIPIAGDMEAWLQKVEACSGDSLVILASGDPLFFGIGRLLQERFDPETLVFHPHVSSVQLAFSRLRLPWQSATVISVHGRMAENLDKPLQQGKSPIAILTDGTYTPSAIAKTILDLRPPVQYKIWVCSELGSPSEQVAGMFPEAAVEATFPQPNVVVLEAIATPNQRWGTPLLGIPDGDLHTFTDRPGLMTKQEVRVLSLAMLRLQPSQVVWDIGSGSGSIAVEIARLLPDARVYAIEKTTAGVDTIAKNRDRFHITNLEIVRGCAPEVLANLPVPHRIMVGGGGRQLPAILEAATNAIAPGGVLVGNFATIEAYSSAQTYLTEKNWQVQSIQANISRSVALKESTRFVPLNPVMILQGICPES